MLQLLVVNANLWQGALPGTEPLHSRRLPEPGVVLRLGTGALVPYPGTSSITY